MKNLKEDVFKVKLEAVGNPDCEGYDYRGDMSHVEPTEAVCSSIEECQKKVKEFIDKHMLGGGNWSGGEVFKNDKFIGYISYNTRFWDKNSEEFKKYHSSLFKKHNCK